MPKASEGKPSGYDVVIRNRNAIKDINRKLKKARKADEPKLIDEKDRLMHEMWAACPHESVAHGEFQSRPGPGAPPIATILRLCVCCGFDEGKPFKILVRRKGRTIARLAEADFKAKLGTTLRSTGINI